MAVKAMRVRVCIVLFFFSVTSDLSVTRVAGGLLEGCRARNIDLLLIADTNFPTAADLTEQKNFFTEILDQFLSPDESEITRLRVAFASMTLSGPVKHFSFSDYNKTRELKEAILNTPVVNLTAQNSSSTTSSPVDNSPFHAFSEGQGGRTAADRVVVMLMSSFTLEAQRNYVLDAEQNDTSEYEWHYTFEDERNYTFDAEWNDTLEYDFYYTFEAERNYTLDVGGNYTLGAERNYTLTNERNHTLEDKRKRVTRDASILPAHNSEYTAFISQACENVYNATILLVFVGKDLNLYKEIITCLLYNDFTVSEEKFTWLTASVAMDLCGEYGRLYDESLNVGSWYYLPYVSDFFRLNWYQTVDRCKATGGELASIETQEELDILLSHLEKLLNRARIWRITMDYFFVVVLSIGLRRNTDTVAARFQWRNGNPLLVSHWLPDYPNREAGQDCGIWEFRHGIPFVEGFVNRGCRSQMPLIPLCEVPLKQHRDREPDLITLPPANRTTFTEALHRGEFTVLRDAIVSVPANIQDLQFLRILLSSDSEFPVFNCEPGIEPGSYIPYSYVCDHKPDCKSGRDETICLYRECDPWPHGEFTCDSGQCIPALSRCDLFKDCYDGSDEEACAECRVQQCDDGTCLPGHYFNDGEIDCGKCVLEWTNCNDDERDSYSFTSHDPCVFTCNQNKCVKEIELNDGIIGCTGPEGPLDETLGKLEKRDFCYSNGLRKWSPVCVYVKDRYGGVLGCRDMSHLSNCQNFTCPEGYVKCPGTYCIPLHYVRDGNMDCPLGEDETNMEPAGCKGNFACWGGKVCLHPDLVCDGSPQCPSGDDELDCRVTCADGFRCIGGTVTIADDFDHTRPVLSLSFISPSTRYLDLSRMDLSFPFTHENRGRFYHLTELHLSRCKLRDASGGFAVDLHHLRTVYKVDFSFNLITEIAEHSMFSYMPNLHHLDLSHNKLLTILAPSGFQIFSEASNIQYLDLSDTAITHINQTILQGLTRLNTLNLSMTKIEQITENTFPENFAVTTLDLRQIPLAEVHPDSLKELTVFSNLYTDNYQLCCPQLRGPGILEHTCHAPREAVSSCLDLVSDGTQRVLLWLVGIFALLGNVVVIVYRIMFDRDVLKKCYGLFVTNLSMADLLMGIYLIIIAGTDVQYRGSYVLHEITWRHSPLCQTAGILSTLSSETSAFFIFLVTVDRFLIIKFPFGQYRFSKVGSVVSCAAAWCVGLLLALIPVLPAFSDWTVYSSSGMCLGLPLTTERPRGWGYSMAVFIFLNFIMFVVIACGQYLIYKAMSENRVSEAAVAQKGARRAQEIMVAKQLSLVALSDFLCWFPIGFMGLLALSGHEISKEAYTWSAVLVLPVNSALNPVLYTVPVLLDKWEKFKTGHFTRSSTSTASLSKSHNGTSASVASRI